MSNLLQAQKKPPVGWYYMWLNLSNTGEPQQDITSSGTSQITTKVEELILYPLVLCPIKCLQGAAATKWTAVLNPFPITTCTNITFKEA
eukprot:11530252-Ditylum_brightwellii.AAC.1